MTRKLSIKLVIRGKLHSFSIKKKKPHRSYIKIKKLENKQQSKSQSNKKSKFIIHRQKKIAINSKNYTKKSTLKHIFEIPLETIFNTL